MIIRYTGQLSQNSTDMSIFIANLVLVLKQCGFTEVTPIGSSNIKAVQFNSLIIEFRQSSNSVVFSNYIEYDSETKTFINSASITVCNRAGGNTGDNVSPLSCSLYVFYSDDGKFLALNIAGHTTQIGRGTLVLFNVKTDNDELFYLYGSSGIGYYSVQQYRGTTSLKRNYAKEENVFFLDEGVPILKLSDSSFVMDMPYLVTLGGAEAQHTYTMTNGDNYYCLLDNIAVKFDTTVFPQITS